MVLVNSQTLSKRYESSSWILNKSNFLSMPADAISVLFLTKYARNGASSRYRTFQYLPHLEQAGIACEIRPLFDEAYLVHRYESGRGHLRDLLRAFIRRLVSLTKARHFDLIVIEYELLPYVPAFLESFLGWLGVPYIVDYDDALFHQYDQHRLSVVRRLLGQKIARVMHGARLVIVGNRYLAEYAHRAGSQRVEIIPTVVDLDRYPPPSPPRSIADKPLTIGWIGSPTTAGYLQTIAPALAAVCVDGRARVSLIGSDPVDLPDVPVDVQTWSEATEVSQLQQCDLGIMPLPDEPWARGKCGFKLIQYMACGLPVVASPVGVNQDIVEPGVNGFLARSDEEWRLALSSLLHEQQLRQRMGQMGRRRVESHYSLQVTAPRLVKAILSARRSQ